MPALSKPTNGTNADYANRIGLLFDAFNNGNYNFPSTQVPSADANTLDDYEEGTFTPTVAGSTTAGTQTYSYNNGTYNKIGRCIFARIAILMTAKDAATAGNVKINGLPFTASATANTHNGVTWGDVEQVTLAGGYTAFGGIIAAGAAQISVYGIGSNVAAADIPAASLGATAAFIASFFYNA